MNGFKLTSKVTGQQLDRTSVQVAEFPSESLADGFLLGLAQTTTLDQGFCLIESHRDVSKSGFTRVWFERVDTALLVDTKHWASDMKRELLVKVIEVIQEQGRLARNRLL